MADTEKTINDEKLYNNGKSVSYTHLDVYKRQQQLLMKVIFLVVKFIQLKWHSIKLKY